MPSKLYCNGLVLGKWKLLSPHTQGTWTAECLECHSEHVINPSYVKDRILIGKRFACPNCSRLAMLSSLSAATQEMLSVSIESAKAIASWINENPSLDTVCIKRILSDVFHKPCDKVSKLESRNIGDLLREHGLATNIGLGYDSHSKTIQRLWRVNRKAATSFCSSEGQCQH